MNAQLTKFSNGCVDGFSQKVVRQHAAYLAGSTDASRRHGGGRVYFEDDESDVYAKLCLGAYRSTVGLPAIARRVRKLELFADKVIVRVSPDELIVGSQRFSRLGFPQEIGQELGTLGYGQNSGHIVHDYAALIENGIAGLMSKIRGRQSSGLSEDGRTTLDAFSNCEPGIKGWR